MNKEPKGLDSMYYYQEKSIIRNGADPKDADLELNGPILVGKFVDVQRPTLWDHLREVSSKAQEKAKARAKV
ncbi:MAG: 2-oxoacid:ferredoxin oxidoreductase subunit beta, partial [Dehalococcoidia bacterium]|nr:2-oxoacid:ferredoxin oxidoreductase subunit beta [Dehalococcoidia bacterium]